MLTIGNIAYLGAAVQFTETSNSGLETDFFDFDVLKRTFELPPTRLKEFLRKYRKNSTDPTFPWLYLVSRSAPKISPVVEITLTYKGTLERDPKPLLASDTRLQPLQLKNSEGGRTQAEYYGPVSTFRYIHVGDHPRTLAHKGEMLLTDFTYEIFNLRGPGNIRIASSGGGAGVGTTGLPGTNVFTLVPRVVTSRFTCEQVGACWQVTEENEGRLEPPEFRPVIGQR